MTILEDIESIIKEKGTQVEICFTAPFKRIIDSEKDLISVYKNGKYLIPIEDLEKVWKKWILYIKDTTPKVLVFPPDKSRIKELRKKREKKFLELLQKQKDKKELNQ